MEITHISQLDPLGTYTYADYLLWQLKEKIQLFKGKIFAMSPAPARFHQEISTNLNELLIPFFKGQKCKIYSAPFDVFFKSADGKESVVQPDICVICDPEKIDSRGCLGVPDLVVEILSPGNLQNELDSKFRIYEEAGVAEYWIVDPEHEAVWVNVLKEGQYIIQKPVAMGKTVTSVKFPDLEISTAEVFAKK